MTTSTKRTVTDLGKLPTEDHWAIIEFSSIYVPGDERSQNYPGHGYPAHDEPTTRYIAFTNYLEWENEVAKKTAKGDKNFAALAVKRATVTVKVQVGVDF